MRRFSASGLVASHESTASLRTPAWHVICFCRSLDEARRVRAPGRLGRWTSSASPRSWSARWCGRRSAAPCGSPSSARRRTASCPGRVAARGRAGALRAEDEHEGGDAAQEPPRARRPRAPQGARGRHARRPRVRAARRGRCGRSWRGSSSARSTRRSRSSATGRGHARASSASAARFATMPLAYERAAGGPGTVEPLRRAHRRRREAGRARRRAPAQPPARRRRAREPGATDPAHRLRSPPRLVPRSPRAPRAARGRPVRPRCSTRRCPRTSTSATSTRRRRTSRSPALRDGERLILQNLHRDHPRLAHRAPRLAPARRSRSARARAPREVDMRCDTLWIDTDRGDLHAHLARASSPSRRATSRGRVLVAMEEPGEAPRATRTCSRSQEGHPRPRRRAPARR